MKLARYAREDVNSDKKKQKCFRRGLNASLREQMVTHIYPDFNTLMDRTILLEEEQVKGEGERKRKFLIQCAHHQERTQRVHKVTPQPQDINRLCSIGHLETTLHKPPQTTRTNTTTTTTSSRTTTT